MPRTIDGITWDETTEAVGHLSDLGRDLLLYGPPGTGKSFLSKSHGLADDQKVYAIACNEDMDPTSLLGHYIVSEGGLFKWHDGVATRAWRDGARLVVDEVHRASGEVLSFLLAILDDRPVAGITLPNGETVKPQPGFHAIGTTNGDPADLDPALQDRFLSIPVNQANPEALKALPKDLRDVAGEYVGLTDGRRTSLRPWFAYADMREQMNPDLAGRIVFEGRWRDVQDTMKLAGAK